MSVFRSVMILMFKLVMMLVLKKMNNIYHITNNDCVAEINNKLKSVNTSSIKYKSLLTDPKSSEETINNVNKVLSGKKNPVACPQCGKFYEMGKGLKLHISKKH